MINRASFATIVAVSCVVACGGDDETCPTCPVDVVTTGSGGNVSDGGGTSDGGGGQDNQGGAGGDGGGTPACVPTSLSWQTTTPLPAPVFLAEAVVVDDTLFVLGGTTTGGSSVDVYAAPIGADGTLGSWVTQAPLPYAGGFQSATTDGSRVFVTGSDIMTGMGFVYYADASSGSIGAWTEGQGEAPFPLFGHGSFVFGERLYVVGGFTQMMGGTPTPSSDVISAGLFGDGSLGNWSIHQQNLLAATNAPGVTLVGDQVLVMGGSTDPMGNAPNGDVQETAVLAAGGTASWSAGVALPAPRIFHAASAAGDRTIVAGGVANNTQGEAPQSTVWVLPPGGTQWETDTALPTGRAGMAAATNDQFIFLAGGAAADLVALDEVLFSAHCQ